jgi:hypothetical protein
MTGWAPRITRLCAPTYPPAGSAASVGTNQVSAAMASGVVGSSSSFMTDPFLGPGHGSHPEKLTGIALH